MSIETLRALRDQFEQLAVEAQESARLHTGVVRREWTARAEAYARTAMRVDRALSGADTVAVLAPEQPELTSGGMTYGMALTVLEEACNDGSELSLQDALTQIFGRRYSVGGGFFDPRPENQDARPEGEDVSQ